MSYWQYIVNKNFVTIATQTIQCLTDNIEFNTTLFVHKQEQIQTGPTGNHPPLKKLAADRLLLN